MTTLVDIWQDDRLGRAKEAELLKRFILHQMNYRSRNDDLGTYVLNIDSSWGEGKTFFLERFQKLLEAEGSISVLVNAWEHDYQDDPLLAVFSQLQSELESIAQERGILDDLKRKLVPLKKSAGEIAARAATGGMKQVVRKLFGEEGDEIAVAVGLSAVEGFGEAFIESFEETQATIINFRSLLSTLVEEISKESDQEPIVFILIDELDRCRPDYAVLLLERVKHLFSVEGIAFILATDTKQLAHAVSGIYGGAYDGRRYLRRFFDRTYKFPEVSRELYVEEKFKSLGLLEDELGAPPDSSAVEFLTMAFTFCAASLRDIRQMMEILQTFCSVWPYQGLKIELPFLLPLIISDFAEGEDGHDIGSLQIRLVYSDDGRRRKEKYISLLSFCDTVNSNGENIFHSKVSGSGDPVSRWVDSIFARERSVLHNNRFLSSDPPGTVLFEYSNLLGVVGRFDPV